METLAVDNVPSNSSLTRATISKNIQAGFYSTRIWESSGNIFTVDDFLCFSISVKPLTTENEVLILQAVSNKTVNIEPE